MQISSFCSSIPCLQMTIIKHSFSILKAVYNYVLYRYMRYRTDTVWILNRLMYTIIKALILVRNCILSCWIPVYRPITVRYGSFYIIINFIVYSECSKHKNASNKNQMYNYIRYMHINDNFIQYNNYVFLQRCDYIGWKLKLYTVYRPITVRYFLYM